MPKYPDAPWMIAGTSSRYTRQDDHFNQVREPLECGQSMAYSKWHHINSKWLSCVQNATVFSLSSGVKHLETAKEFSVSAILGSTYAIQSRQCIEFLEWTQKHNYPPFFTETTGSEWYSCLAYPIAPSSSPREFSEVTTEHSWPYS